MTIVQTTAKKSFPVAMEPAAERPDSTWAKSAIRFLAHYGIGVTTTLLALGIRLALRPLLGHDAPLLLFTLAIMGSAALGGVNQGLIATGLSALVGVYFFTEPLYSLEIRNPREGEELVLFFVVGILITCLADRMRQARTRAEEVQVELARAYMRERRITEALQDSLLRLPEPDAFPGLHLHGFYEAAREEARVGGDLYDAFTVEDGRKVALVVGDVAGKGLLAAARTVETKTALRAYLHQTADPATALTLLNHYLAGRLETEDGATMFVALAVAVLDPRTGEGVVAIAGGNPPVGLFDNLIYEAQSIQLEVGESLLLFTDGLTEARFGKAFFGSEGIQHTAARLQTENRRVSPSALGVGIVSAARDFAHNDLRDDVCLLIARREPLPE